MKGIRISRGSSGVIDASKMRARAGVVEPTSSVTLSTTLSLRLGRGQNDRPGHYQAAARVVAAERQAVYAALLADWGAVGREFVQHVIRERRTEPVNVVLTRLGGKGLDGHDNLRAACKACVDEVTAWLGFASDSDPRLVWSYGQEPGTGWGVRVEIHAGRQSV